MITPQHVELAEQAVARAQAQLAAARTELRAAREKWTAAQRLQRDAEYARAYQLADEAGARAAGRYDRRWQASAFWSELWREYAASGYWDYKRREYRQIDPPGPEDRPRMWAAFDAAELTWIEKVVMECVHGIGRPRESRAAVARTVGRCATTVARTTDHAQNKLIGALRKMPWDTALRKDQARVLLRTLGLWVDDGSQQGDNAAAGTGL